MTISIFNKSKGYQRPDIKDNDQINQLARCYDVSKRLVSFRYHLKGLCDVLGQSHLCTSWYIATTSQIRRFYLLTRDIGKTSQIGSSYWRASLDVVMMSQNGPGRSNGH